MAGAGHLWATDEAPSVGDALLIASGAAGLRQIKRIPTDVPGRDQGRPNWTRERFCAVALIRHLFKVREHLFPLRVERVDSPDFVFAPSRPDSPAVAVEVTDAGEFEYQRFLDRTAACSDTQHIPSPGDLGWEGDAPERQMSMALGEAVQRKLAHNVWRRAIGLPRWLVLYDNTNAGGFTADADAEDCLREQVQPGREGGLSALVLVRALDLVWMVECD